MENDGEVDWLVKDMCEELRAWRHPGRDGNRVFLKSDGQPVMQSLKTAIGRFHGGVLIPDVSARGESQSNGAVERAAQVVAELVRVLKEQLEQKATVQVWANRYNFIVDVQMGSHALLQVHGGKRRPDST